MPAPQCSEYLLSAPTERMLVRRGDPLGLRAAADAFADILAPGLTNRTYDARWLTLLSWILVSVDDARRNLHLDHDEVGLARQRAIYEWIRPLELMWIELAVRTFGDRRLMNGRQLPGRNALLRFVGNENGLLFGMTDDQLRRYRFTGPHGAYRSMLGTLAGMTIEGDGHRPGPLARRLARLITAPSIHHPRRRKGRKPTPVAYWKDAWKGRVRRGGTSERWLPGRWNSKPNLFAEESRVIRAALFDGPGDPERRRTVANAAVRSEASEHAGLCRDVVQALRPVLDKEDLLRLAPIVPFTRLADTGVDAMVAIWEAVRSAIHGPAIDLTDLSKNRGVKIAMGRLVRSCERWRKDAKHAGATLLVPAHTLAAAIETKKSLRMQVEALLLHHLKQGGGRRWFQIDGVSVSPDTPTGGHGAAPYRFRLWSLARLAWQTGLVERMPRAFSDTDERDDEEPEEGGA